MEYAFVAVVIAGLGFLVWFGIRERKAGTDAIARDVAEESADVAARQADAQANAPRSKDSIVDRLRKEGL
jgi:hypothetical protein